MNTRRLISILLGAAVLFGAAAFGQGARHGQDEDFPGRGVILDPVIADLRAELANLQAELAEKRRDLIASLEGVSEDERMAELTRFRVDNAELIAGIHELSADLRDAVREYRPGRPDVPAVPNEILAARRELSVLRAELAESRAAALSDLGEDASAEDIAAALAAWREANKESIDEAADLQAEINDWFAENRSVRRGPPADVDPELAERRNAFRESAHAMREERAELRSKLRDAESVEDRKELMEEFGAKQRELMKERREIRRLERLSRDADGDRRPGG